MDLNSIFNLEQEEKDTIKLAYYVIDYCYEKNIDLTNLKLQKLLYFINIDYMLANQGNPIFTEEFLAWRHGPVLQSVYDVFKFGIVETSTQKIEEIKKGYNSKTKKIIDNVLKNKAKEDAWDLVNEAHEVGGPWYKVFHNQKVTEELCFSSIPHSLIYSHYSKKI